MKSKNTILVISSLVAFNLLLIYLNINLRDKINKYGLKNDKWGFEKVGLGIPEIVHPDIKLNGKGLNLLVFITDHGCLSCLKYEIRLLDKYSEKYEDFINIYLLSLDKSYLKQFQFSFPVKVIAPTESLLNNSFDFSNPVAILIDGNNKIQEIQIAQTGKPVRRKRFYEKMISLYQTMKHDYRKFEK